MELNLNSWDFVDLRKDLSIMTASEILDVYKVKDDELTNKCVLLLKDKDNKYLANKCSNLYQEKLIIATHLADKMTGVISIL